MYYVTFFENRSLIMSKLTTTLPTENENINLKGRKGTVLSVEKLDDKHINVHVALEKVIKKSAVLEPNKKRK
ncbi:Preprotein translocase subunit SecA OS=Ureibacillus acetophenoni OX=614649 GN=SAMN05877842_103225 PE=4 SV=1 [Ureibacillus acetophenoni]